MSVVLIDLTFVTTAFSTFISLLCFLMKSFFSSKFFLILGGMCLMNLSTSILFLSNLSLPSWLNNTIPEAIGTFLKGNSNEFLDSAP